MTIPSVSDPSLSGRDCPPADEAFRVDWQRWAKWIWPLALYGILLVWLSDGNYHNDDTLHYLCSRNAWHTPRLFLDVWARPGFTVPYAFVAWIGGTFTGLFCCRLLSLGIVIAVAALTTATAKRLRIPNAEWAGLITLLLPLHFQLSVTTLTETICSLYLIAATLLFVEDRPRASALVLSLTMLTRHEAILFVAGGMLLFCWRREWLAALLIWTGEVVWNLVSIWSGAPEHPWTRYLPSSDRGYGSAGPLWGIVMWVEAVGPVAILLTLWGGYRLVCGAQLPANRLSLPSPERNGEGELPSADSFSVLLSGLDGSRFSSVSIGRWLVVGGALGLVLLQTLLFMFNRFASGGYARFLVPAAPWMALCILQGIDSVRSRLLDAGPLGGHAVKQFSHYLRITLFLAPAIALGTFFAYPDRPSIACMFTFFYGVSLFAVAVVLAALGRWMRSSKLLTASSVGFVAAWGASWAGGALPLGETPTQSLHRDACQWISEQPHLKGLPVACLSPVGTMYTDNWRLPEASIWELPAPGKPILVIDDLSVMRDAPLQARLEQLSFVELKRFEVGGNVSVRPQSDVVVFRTEIAPVAFLGPVEAGETAKGSIQLHRATVQTEMKRKKSL